MHLVFKIAKHYWLNGENATWSVSESFDHKALAWFKDQYSLLEGKRPSFKEFQDKTVFFIYSDTEDIYGRNITEIAAILVDVLFRSPENVQTLLSHHLKKIPPADLDLTLFIHDSDIINPQISGHVGTDKRKKRKPRKWLIMTSTIIIVLVGIIYLLFSDSKDVPKTVLKTSVTQTDHIQKTDIENVAANRASVRATPSTDETKKKHSNTQNIRDKFCSKYKKLLNKKEDGPLTTRCFFIFMKDQCINKGPRISYKGWLAKTDPNICDIPHSANKNEDLNDGDLNEWKGGRDQVDSVRLIDSFFAGQY